MDEEISIWDKTQDEVTMDEYVKIALGIAFVTAAIPAVFAGIGYVITSYVEKRKREKLEKIVEEFKQEKNSKEQE